MTEHDAPKSRQCRRRSPARLLAPMTLATLLALPAGWAEAGTYTVVTTTDGTGSGTLRAAIAYANANPGSTIDFSLPAASTITLGSSLPAITAATTIDGSAVSGLTISGAGFNVFNVNDPGGTVAVQSLAVTNSGGSTVTAGTLQGTTTSLPGNITNNGTVAFNQSAVGTYAGVISGTGSVTVFSSDSAGVTFTGTNTYTGGTTINNAQLLISKDANLGGTGAGSGLTLIDGALDVTASLTSARAISLPGIMDGQTLISDGVLSAGAGVTATFSGVISGAGPLVVNGFNVGIVDTGTVVLTGANTYTGGTVVNGGTLQGTTSSLQGPIIDFTQSGSINGTTVAFNQSTAGTFNGTISGNGAVTVAGGGTVTFANANSYTGGTTVLAGGSLAGTSSTLLGSIVDNGTVTLNVTGSATTGSTSSPFGLNLTGTGTLDKGGTGTLTIAGNQVFGGTIGVASGSLNVADGSSLEADGGIKVSGRLQLDGPGAVVSGGTLTVASGGTVAGSGTINNSLAVASGGAVSLNSSSDLIFNGATNSNAGTINLGGGTIEFGGALANTGVITGRGALYTAESAPGTLGLTNSGQMNFSGGFTDIHGLVQNNAGATITSGGGGVVTFNDGLTNLGAVNTVAGSRTVIYGTESGAGNFIGTGAVEIDGKILIDPARVSFAGSLTLTRTADYVMEIGGTQIGSQYDSLAVAGRATLAGTLDVDLIDGFAPTLGESFVALSYGSYTGAFDRINGLGLGDGLELVATYTATDLILTVEPAVVPEPASVVLVGLGLVGASVVARRRAGARTGRRKGTPPDA